eukprot:Nk52_evm29s223 gene=Nk52_evmTU29s223
MGSAHSKREKKRAPGGSVLQDSCNSYSSSKESEGESRVALPETCAMWEDQKRDESLGVAVPCTCDAAVNAEVATERKRPKKIVAPLFSESDLRKGKAEHFTKTKVENLKVFVGTWNLGNERPGANGVDISDWIPLGNEGDYDIYVIGTQECAYGSFDKNKFSTYEEEWYDVLKRHICGSSSSRKQSKLHSKEKSLEDLRKHKIFKHLLEVEESRNTQKSLVNNGEAVQDGSVFSLFDLHQEASSSLDNHNDAKSSVGSRQSSSQSNTMASAEQDDKREEEDKKRTEKFNFLKNYTCISDQCITPMTSGTFDNIHSFISAIELGEAKRGQIHMHVFVKDELRSSIKHIKESLGTCGRLEGLSGNKGSLACSFQIMDTTLCFVNVHLNAHEHNFNRRNQDIRHLNRILEGVYSDMDLVNQCPYVFWFGDLNYRLGNITKENCLKKIEEKEYSWLLEEHDQLIATCRDDSANPLFGFKEFDIAFPPTYKMKKGENTYNTKSRIPSYTDRVLYKCFPGSEVELINYDSCPSIVSSDHTPVYCTFEIKGKVADGSLLSKLWEGEKNWRYSKKIENSTNVNAINEKMAPPNSISPLSAANAIDSPNGKKNMNKKPSEKELRKRISKLKKRGYLLESESFMTWEFLQGMCLCLDVHRNLRITLKELQCCDLKIQANYDLKDDMSTDLLAFARIMNTETCVTGTGRVNMEGSEPIHLLVKEWTARMKNQYVHVFIRGNCGSRVELSGLKEGLSCPISGNDDGTMKVGEAVLPLNEICKRFGFLGSFDDVPFHVSLSQFGGYCGEMSGKLSLSFE